MTVAAHRTARFAELEGETEAALEHLRAAVALRPSLADVAPHDADLEPLRDDPGFRELVG